jgi:hypothetical protein
MVHSCHPDCQSRTYGAILPRPTVRLHPRDIVAHQGVDYLVENVQEVVVGGRGWWRARLAGGGRIRHLELAADDLADRALLLDEIPALDISAPPPATIYHRGESFLLQVAGTATVKGSDRQTGVCQLWRYRAAGGRFLQIEAWDEGLRTLAGASVHLGMIEVRPATS